MHLRDEIYEQPTVVARLLEQGPALVGPIAERILGAGVEHVVIAARGTSDHAAIYAQYLWGVRNRLTVALAAPSIVTLYGVAPRFGRSLVVGISQSGASPDVVAVVAAARAQGAPTLAITNTPGSPLAEAAEYVIDLGAGAERAIAATKTYTAELTAVALLSTALLDDAAARRSAEADLAALPEALERALAAEPTADAVAAEMAGADRAIVLGRGLEYATAREWALKIKELANLFADPYSAADFQHGPVALIEPDVPVLAVAPAGAIAAGMVELLCRLRDEHGAQIAILSDDASIRALGRWAVPIPEGVAEWVRPIVSIVPAQLHALALTIARGLDPERPRGLRKVTRTV
ncbi:MAG: glucosamine--fructose-6-phosphate aminotransferase [Chloroflexota bacterium]